MNYYNDISNLPLNVFIDILDTNNVELLIVDQDPGQKVLQTAWNAIFSEYSKLTNSTQTKSILNIIKYINVTRIKVELIQACIVALSSDYYEALAVFLKTQGIRTEVRKETLLDDLRRVKSELKRFILLVNEKQNELDAMANEEVNIRQDFSLVLIQISQALGFRFSSRDNTVLDFCMSIKNIKNAQRSENNRVHR